MNDSSTGLDWLSWQGEITHDASLQKTAFGPIVVAGGLFPLSSSVHAASAPASFRDGVLVDASGHSLYTYDRDTTPGRSACNDGPCVAIWPPYTRSAGEQSSARFSVFKRDDGSMQWVYRGKPLYRYIADQKPGDIEGDGANDVWHLIRK